MIYNLLDFRLIVSDANPTLGDDGVFALWVLRACSYKPKGETAHQGLSTERRSIRRKHHLRFLFRLFTRSLGGTPKEV
jgi:hypothetical protein